MDKQHDQFVKNLLLDKDVDKREVLRQYGDNYTEKVRKFRRHRTPDMFEKAGSDCSDSSDELDEEIMKKNLRGKHHIDFIGIKPKIDTNRPLTKV